MNYQDVVFKECETHKTIRYACEHCPVCEREILILAAEEEILQLQNQIAGLEMTRATSAAE